MIQDGANLPQLAEKVRPSKKLVLEGRPGRQQEGSKQVPVTDRIHFWSFSGSFLGSFFGHFRGHFLDHFLVTFWTTFGCHFGADGPGVIFTAGLGVI